MAIFPQRLTIYLYSAHRAVIFAIAQLSCYNNNNNNNTLVNNNTKLLCWSLFLNIHYTKCLFIYCGCSNELLSGSAPTVVFPSNNDILILCGRRCDVAILCNCINRIRRTADHPRWIFQLENVKERRRLNFANFDETTGTLLLTTMIIMLPTTTLLPRRQYVYVG